MPQHEFYISAKIKEDYRRLTPKQRKAVNDRLRKVIKIEILAGFKGDLS